MIDVIGPLCIAAGFLLFVYATVCFCTQDDDIDLLDREIF